MSDPTLSPTGLAAALGRARRGVLLVLVAALPLVFAWDVTNQPYAVPKLALLAAAVAVAAGLRAGEAVLGAPAGRLRLLVAPAAFVAVPTTVAWLAADYRQWSVLGAYGRYEGLAPTLLVVAAGVLLADAFASAPRKVAWAFAGSAACSATYGVLQALALDPLSIPIVEYAPATIGHSNFAGGFLAMALPVALGLSATSRGALRLAGAAVSIAVVLGLLVSFSQGGWLAAAGGVAVYAGGELGSRRPRLKALGWVAAGAVAAAGIGLVVLSLLRPFHPVVPDTARARGLWWREAAAMGADSPVWGHGPNAYAIDAAQYRNPEDALAHDHAVADAPHSVPLSLFANHGLLGVAGFAALVTWTVRRGLATAGSPVVRGFAAGAAAYFVQSFVSIDMIVLTFSLWVCLAALPPGAREPHAVADPRDPPGAARVLVAGLAALAVALPGVAWSARLVAGDARVHGASEDFDAGRTEEALDSLEDVVERYGVEHYRHVYGSTLGAAAMREREDGADEIERMKAAFSYLDDLPDVRALASYAESLHRWSIFRPAAEADALEQLRRLLALDPYSPSVRAWTAEALIRLGRPDEAVEVMEPMIPLVAERLPEYGALRPGVWGALAIAQFYAGDPQSARDAVAAAHAASGERAERDCHVLVAEELLRTGGEVTPRADLIESSPGLLLCRPPTLALLPGYDPEDEH